MKKRFLYAGDFAKAELTEIFGTQQLKEAVKWTINESRSMLFINEGIKGYMAKPLPWQQQLSPVRSIISLDADKDGDLDYLLAGNFYENNVQLGRNDADLGSFLINEGGGKLSYRQLPGVHLKGQVRKLQAFNEGVFIVRNNGETSFLSLNQKW